MFVVTYDSNISLKIFIDIIEESHIEYMRVIGATKMTYKTLRTMHRVLDQGLKMNQKIRFD